MDIILDTNSIHNDFFLNGTDINKIVIKAKPGGHNIYIPEVVTEEMNKHFAKGLENSYKQIEKGFIEFERTTGVSPGKHITKNELDAEIKGYSRKLKGRIKDLGISILPVPKDHERAIMIKAVNRKKPFKDTGAGCPDVLIWATILEQAKRFGEVDSVISPRIVFVSNNHTDFCTSDDYTLHPELCSDLDEYSIKKETIKIVPTIDEASKMLLVTSDDILTGDILKYISSPGFKGTFLYEQLVKRIMKYLPYKSFHPDDLGFGDAYEDPSIDMFDEDFVFEPDSVEILSETEVSVKWDVSVTCLFDFYVYKPDLPLFDDHKLSVYDWNWNDHYVAAQQEKNVWFSVEIITDEKHWNIKNFEMEINSERNNAGVQ